MMPVGTAGFPEQSFYLLESLGDLPAFQGEIEALTVLGAPVKVDLHQNAFYELVDPSLPAMVNATSGCVGRRCLPAARIPADIQQDRDGPGSAKDADVHQSSSLWNLSMNMDMVPRARSDKKRFNRYDWS